MRLSKKHWILLQAAALMVAVGGFLLVRPHLARAVGVNPLSMTGNGTLASPYSIKTCQDLQDVSQNLSAFYTIDNDIDCTATNTWNSGSGFAPIGSDASPFTGHIDGHNHTINGLYMNKSTNDTAPDVRMGIFRKISGATLLNFHVTNATVYGISVLDGAQTGGIVGEMHSSIIADVHFGGNIIMESCNLNEKIGGIVGVASSHSGDPDNTINSSSATGSITVQDSGNCGTFQHTIGGLIGKSGAAGIANVYTDMAITINGTQQSTCLDTHCRDIGGIVGAKDASLDVFEISNSYSAGSITIQNDTGSDLSYNVGGLFGTLASNVSTHHVFSTTDMSVPATCDNITCNSNTLNLGGFAGSSNGNGGNWEDYWYDYTRFDHAHCTGETNANDGRCQTFNDNGSAPDYLMGSSNVNPISSWDIANVWQIIDNEWPELRTSSVPNPATPETVTTTIDSGTQITVNWGETTPANELSKFIILCKPASQTQWSYCADNIDPNTHTYQLTGLNPGTSYNIAVYAQGVFGYYSLPGLITSSTATPGFTLINSCTDLQNMNNDLEKNYELAHDIDCSDTINWDSGQGFMPIGILDFINNNFGAYSGIFKGNNYAISNLYCARTTSPLDTCALFGYTDKNALIQDVKLKSFNLNSTYVSASLIGAAVHTTVKNVQVTDLDIHGETQLAGGLIGATTPQILYGPGVSDIERSSVTGAINLTGSNSNVGGFIGGLVSSSDTVQNNYANVDINTDSTTLAGGFVGDLQATNDAHITNNYAAGNLNVLSSDPDLNTAPSYSTNFPTNISLTGGFTGLLIIASPNVLQNNFSHVSLSNASPEAVLGGFIGASANQVDLSSNYFDADYANVNTCENTISPSGTTCTGMTGQPDYFKNNSSNPPLNQWDFTNIWAVNPSFPLFSYSSTASITSIPPERLNPTPTPGTNNQSPTPVASSTTDTTTKVSGNSTSDITVNQTDETGVLGAIKHFVRSLPVAVVVGFPYALFALLLIAALVLLIELIRELRRLHELQALLTKQRLLAEERDAFWHLAANYLRAPVTLIVGGAEALREANAIDAAAGIATLAASLQKKVADIMAKIEGSTSLQAISNVQPRKAAQVARKAIFIVPVVLVAALTILANYAASSFRNLNPGFIGYTTQIIGFVIATILFYWVLSLLTNGKRKRQAAQDQLDRQTNELANARHELINNTANSLNPDLTKLEGMIKLLPAAVTASAAGAISTLSEGTSRLREIVNSFTMLIKVQEGTGIVTAAPEASTIDLSGILAKTRAKLTPQITAKHVNISAPAVPLAVTAEADLANQVLESIIANAVDYSPEGGTVKIEARRLQDAIQLRISDQGQGINKNQLDHLFQPFVRTDGKSAMDMSHGGFGINLYLDKLIMEQLGGSIAVDSTPGKGTAFTMTWPV